LKEKVIKIDSNKKEIKEYSDFNILVKENNENEDIEKFEQKI
jgi:hypothetical protein